MKLGNLETQVILIWHRRKNIYTVCNEQETNPILTAPAIKRPFDSDVFALEKKYINQKRLLHEGLPTETIEKVIRVEC